MVLTSCYIGALDHALVQSMVLSSCHIGALDPFIFILPNGPAQWILPDGVPGSKRADAATEYISPVSLDLSSPAD